MKTFTYLLEALAVKLLFTLFRLLPLDISSAIGGEIGRLIGPFFSAHKTARRNLGAAFPEKTPREVKAILGDMWENLGRTAAEMSSVPGTRLTSRIEVVGAQYFPPLGKPVLFFGGHLGNWELLYPIAYDRGVHLTLIYRHINNPYVDKMVGAIRRSHSNEIIAKGLRGGVKMLAALKRGGSIAMLIDQKLNTGLPIPFFGRDAMTATAIADIALKYDIPIIPARVIRTQGAHFKGVIYPPLAYEKTGDREKDTRAVMTEINAMLEGWIREHPEQWFWVHRRWP
jgi:KDO2-lipid IV(A) lauroyltransferase